MSRVNSECLKDGLSAVEKQSSISINEMLWSIWCIFVLTFVSEVVQDMESYPQIFIVKYYTQAVWEDNGKHIDWVGVVFGKLWCCGYHFFIFAVFFPFISWVWFTETGSLYFPFFLLCTGAAPLCFHFCGRKSRLLQGLSTAAPSEMRQGPC